jgi:arsenate reductase
MSESGITIFHNPACGTSRNALAMIRETGVEPTVVEYLKTGWTADQLKGLLKAMGKTPRDVMRVRGTPAEELGLTEPSVSDETIITAMVAHPILVERPIVQTPKGVRLGRPIVAVREVL